MMFVACRLWLIQQLHSTCNTFQYWPRSRPTVPTYNARLVTHQSLAAAYLRDADVSQTYVICLAS